MANRPKPTRLKQLAGNPGKRRLNPAEPKPKLGTPKRPKFITGLARREWNAIVPQLVALGILGEVEHAAVSGYCLAFAAVAEAKAEIERLGLVITAEVQDKDGNFHVTGARKNPACTVLDAALKQLRAFSSELGLSPSSRSKIQTLPAKSEAMSRAESYFIADNQSLI
jgi:P27 family predicted phage terminase small subunit